MKQLTILILSTFVLASWSFSQQFKVKSDAVKISFVADMQETEGTIGGFEATIIFNKDNLSKSKISGSVDVKTLDTGIWMRNKHLHSGAYFDANEYPKITFESTSFEQQGDHFVMNGNMTIKAITHKEKITFTFDGNTFKGNSNIKLSNYKVGKFSEDKPENTDVKINFYIPVEK